MEHIPGITLSEKVAAGPLQEKEVIRLRSCTLAEGLAAALMNTGWFTGPQARQLTGYE